MSINHSVRSYRPEIDGLRCIAVTAVILYHAGVTAFSGGYVGVDIFFVISGYLITSIIFDEMQRGEFSFGRFYERRARRIFPALFFVSSIAIPFAWITLSPGQLKIFFQSLVATIAFSSNIFFYLKSGYFSEDAENYPLIHMWSLAVEEQFYIIFPIILLIILKIRKPPINAIFAVLFILSILFSISIQNSNQVANFFLTPFRAWALIAGALIAINDDRLTRFARAHASLSAAIEIAGVLLIFSAIFLLDKSTPFPGIYAIPPVLGTAFIISASHARSPVGRVLASKPFVAIGLISYSAYLWHQPLFAFVRIGTAAPLSALLTWGLIALTFILAWFSWRFIEQPFRKKQTFSRRQIFTTAATLSIFLAATGLAGHHYQGFSGRFDESRQLLAETALPSPKRDICHTDGLQYRKPADACRYFGKDVRWAILGDSHAIEIGYALAEDLRAKNIGLLHLSFSGCQPALTFESDNPGCSAWLQDSVNYLKHSSQIEDVVLAFRHAFYLYGDQTKTYPRLPTEHPNFLLQMNADRARAAYWTSFESLVQQLSAAGKRVYIVGPIPELPTHAERYIYGRRSAGQSDARIAGTTTDWYRRRQSTILAHIAALRSIPNVSIIDSSMGICDARDCNAILNGQSLYFDDNHFSLVGARNFVAVQRRAGMLP